MKKCIFLFIAFILFKLATPLVFAQTPQTTIIIDTTQPIQDVNRLVFGQNLYDQILSETGKKPDELIPLLKETHATILRFPGGLFADLYHWYDAIGQPSERQPVCKHLSFEPFNFSLEEFLNLAEKVGAEVVYTINEDRAEPEEARDFIEYTNGILTQDIKQRAINEQWLVDGWRHGQVGTKGYLAGSMPSGYYAWLRSQLGYGGRETPWKIKY